MLNILASFIFGNKNFGLCLDNGHPYLSIFGLEIYLYAIIIVFGMCMAILTAGLYFKKRGYDPYDITIYALAVIPIGVLGARAYVYIFPWHGGSSDWSTYFQFRSGGLGIYGGVIMGYLAAAVCAKIKKQDFRIVVDSIMPGLFLAQSIGRWGNYFNEEAYGNLIENLAPPVTESVLPHFNGYAVWIVNGNQGTGWYQATFFYESVCTFLGFLICVLVLTR
ncbi:MAG: prolipoprotein diacylglyceryl transferase, partial [Corallococcus sp.]|nr:prolipoprotein diacylglyceryl transferase [Corallococcus sp.]